MSAPKKITVQIVKPTLPVISKELAEEVRDKLIVSRISMLLNAPFFGTLATRLILRADDSMPTAATEGRHFFFNHEFIKKLTPEETIFLMGHEVLHCVYDHMGRRGERDPKLWNIAADYAINLDLVDQNIGKLITTVPALYDVQYRGMSADQIYELLEEKYKNQTAKDKAEIQGLLDKMFDSHMDPGDEEDADGKGKDGLTAAERRRVRDEFREAVINAAKGCEAGDMPMGVRRMVDALTAPKMNWRELLRSIIQSAQFSDYTWMKPSRLAWDLDAILPGVIEEPKICIGVAIDMSGSISQEQGKDFLSEIKGIMEAFPRFEIDVWTFDTQVYGHKQYTSDNLEDIADYELQGGGGTSFQCNWDWMKENDIKPDRLVFFTDMYTGDGFGDPDYVETLWIVHQGDPKCNPGHGVVCDYSAA